MRRVAITQVAQSSGVESRENLMDFTYKVNKEILRSRQVMFAISSNEAIDISGLFCLL